MVDVAEVPDADPGAMGAFRASLIEDLYARNYADIDTAVETAVFQMSIWEIIHEVGSNGNDFVLSDLDLGWGWLAFRPMPMMSLESRVASSPVLVRGGGPYVA